MGFGSGFGGSFTTATRFRPTAVGGTAGVTDYSNYANLPASPSDGDWGHTTNDGRVWRYLTIAGLWIPASAYNEGPAFLNNGDNANWTPASTADADGDESYDNATDIFANGWTRSQGGDGAIADSSGSPRLSVSSGWGSNKFLSWTKPDSDRYLVILDWDVVASGGSDNCFIRFEDGTTQMEVTGYAGAVNKVAWNKANAAVGEGIAATSSGTPFFVIIDCSAAASVSKIIVPGVTDEPSVERQNMETSSGTAFNVGVNPSATFDVDRVQIFTLGD